MLACIARSYVGLGANLGDRADTMQSAVDLLAGDPEIEVIAVSTLRLTEPVDFLDQPEFLNGVAALDTNLPPLELLARLLAVERLLGRVRGGPRYGPRSIDLDLLLYGDEVVDEAGLTVPHPRIHRRRFVLEPLAELDPELTVPGHGPVRELLAALE